MQQTYLECGEHLTLFFTINQAVMVLHRDERGEVVCDCVVYVPETDADVDIMGGITVITTYSA